MLQGRALAVAGLMLLLESCGPADITGPAPTTGRGAVDTYTIGGTVSGLVGASVVLQNNGGDDLTQPTNGLFGFSTQLASGSAYTVTVHTSSPNQVCSVANGSGVVGTSNVTNILVSCVAAFRVNVNVSGLLGSGLVLQNNGTDPLVIATDGSAQFSLPMGDSAAYAVTVRTQPGGQACSVRNGSGIIVGADVMATVVCATDQYSISVTLLGLGSGVGEIELINSISTSRVSVLQPRINGGYSFPATVPDGFAYTVQVSVQPSTSTQVCSVANAMGTVAAASVSNVQVTCIFPSWTGIKQFGPNNGARAVATDASGNVYVAGSRGNVGDAGAGPYLAKYNPSGTQLWLRQFEYTSMCSPAMNALRHDAANDRLVIGGTFFDGGGTIHRCLAWLTLDGTAIRVQDLGSVASNGSLKGIAVDAVGAVYAVGDRGDIWLSKYDAAGVEEWTRTRGSNHGPLQGDVGESIAVHGGSVYVVGSVSASMDGQGIDFASGRQAALLRYDTSGTWLWTRVVDGSSTQTADARYYSVAVDGAGNIFAAARFIGAFAGQSPSGFSDVAVMRYDSSGGVGSPLVIGGVGDDDRPGSLAAASGGGVYLAGESDSVTVNSQVNAGGRDALLVRVGSGNTVEWTRLLGSSTDDSGYAVAVDSQGSLFLVGFTAGVLPTSGATVGQNAFVAKYDQNGQLQ